MNHAPDGTEQRKEVRFFSDGLELHGVYHRPPEPTGGVVFLPGSRVTKRTPFYTQYIERLVAGGLAILLIDYRGWGESEGTRGTLYPLEQVADARNGITWLSTRPELEGLGLGLFGVSMGGAHAVYAAGLDDRIATAVAVLSPMDGERMLRQTRREYEWVELVASLEEDRRRRVLEGVGATTDQLSPPTPERSRTTAMAPEPPPPIPLACLDAIREYRPIDMVSRIAPRAVLWFAATQDPVCPIEHSREAYEQAAGPKRLVEIPSNEHYGTYLAHRNLIVDESLRWFGAHLRPDGTREQEQA